MFSFLKQTISVSEFGLWVLKYADEFISADALRSLGSTFPNYDASREWTPVFESNGVPIPTVMSGTLRCSQSRSQKKPWRRRRRAPFLCERM
jgi:hypothetical protein